MTKIFINPGHLLLANPNNPKDELSRSVMLLLSHTHRMSIALQLNNPVVDFDLRLVANGLGMEYHYNEPVYYGGSTNTHKVHVIHSSEWKGISTIQLNDEISVTSDVCVIKAITDGTGPDHYRACAGYWAWFDGKLDHQLDPISRKYPHTWEIAPATIENVFTGEGPDQWRATLGDSTKYQINEWFD
jgi:putative transcriptional regulator